MVALTIRHSSANLFVASVAVFFDSVIAATRPRWSGRPDTSSLSHLNKLTIVVGCGRPQQP